MKNQILSLFIVLNSISLMAQNVSDRISQMDIDLQIRASEDPNFDQYLIDLEKQQILAKESSIRSKEIRIETRAKERAIRLAYSAKRKFEKQREERVKAQAFQIYQKQMAAQDKSLAIQRKAFVAQKEKDKAKEALEKKKLIARMQSRLSRMPASFGISKRKRIPRENREKTYQKVLERNKKQRMRRR